jgi:hypothetical protein
MASPDNDRRVAVRLLRNVDAPFRSGVDLGTATVRDLSLTGVGLVFAQQVQPGQIIAIELPVQEPDGWRLKLFKVAHATSPDGKTWIAGGPFVHPLTEEELKLLA